MGEADFGQKRAHAVTGGLQWNTIEQFAKTDILCCRERRNQLKKLKEKADPVMAQISEIIL